MYFYFHYTYICSRLRFSLIVLVLWRSVLFVGVIFLLLQSKNKYTWYVCMFVFFFCFMVCTGTFSHCFVCSVFFSCIFCSFLLLLLGCFQDPGPEEEPHGEHGRGGGRVFFPEPEVRTAAVSPASHLSYIFSFRFYGGE